MLQLQRNRIAAFRPSHVVREQVRWEQSDAMGMGWNVGQCDLLVTAFFLDCFTPEDLMKWLPRWLSAVRPGGYFYCVDFFRPPSGWRRMRGDFYLALMHWWFRWQTGLRNRKLVDLDAVLRRQSLSLIAEKTSNHGLISTRLYRIKCSDANRRCQAV